MNLRLKKIRTKMKKLGVDSFITATPSNADPNVVGTNGWANVHWLTGYTGSNGLVIVSDRNAYFITDFRYKEQAARETKDSGFKLIIAERDLYSQLGKLKPSVFGAVIGFEEENLTYQYFKILRRLFKGKKVVATKGVFGELRAVKEDGEIRYIKKAVKITDETFAEVLSMVKSGVAERDLALEIEYRFRQKGGGIAFDTIVASGWRSSLPHGKASNKKIKKGEFITFDMGATYNGYSADMTRTVVLGKANKKQKEIYGIVREAQSLGISLVRAGIRGRDVDKEVRDFIAEKGYGKYFGHGLGHGIGLVTHDMPVLSPSSKWVLGGGMVVTVEPGIYIPGWGGVRIEDDIVVKKEGRKILNKSPKELIEL